MKYSVALWYCDSVVLWFCGTVVDIIVGDSLVNNIPALTSHHCLHSLSLSSAKRQINPECKQVLKFFRQLGKLENLSIKF